MAPKVSVIIPVFNRAHCIERALKSALIQTIEDIEIILCDDFSTDSTREIINSYVKKDRRIKLICNSYNSGAAEARNIGLKQATGEYIAFLDSDDEWLPRKLEYQIKELESKPLRVGVCFCGAKIIKTGSIFNNASFYIPKKSWEIDTFKKYVKGKIEFLTSTIMFKRACIRKVGLMESEMRRNQDVEYLLRLFSNFDLVVIPEPLAYIYLTVSPRNQYYKYVKDALKHHLKHCEEIKRRYGYWTAKYYECLNFTNILRAAIYERKWKNIWVDFYRRVMVFPIFSFREIVMLIKSFGRAMFFIIQKIDRKKYCNNRG